MPSSSLAARYYEPEDMSNAQEFKLCETVDGPAAQRRLQVRPGICFAMDFQNSGDTSRGQ